MEIGYKKIQAYKDELIEIQNFSDIELAHIDADDVLCRLLIDLDLKYIVDEFIKIEKWYA